MTTMWRACALAGLLATGCGDDTATDGGGGEGGGGAPPSSTVEAGFIEVPEGAVGSNWRAKMFFSFQPAEVEDAPLLVFFNGGPGSATSGLLMSYGTGPMTLDGLGDPFSGPVENPNSYTRFANLLFLDERMTGFSYGVQSSLGDPECVDDAHTHLQDAADFVYALLEFLDAHPDLTGRRVVLVGESYGGTRAPLMLHLLQHYAVDPDPPIDELGDIHARAPWLRERVQAHYDEVTPTARGVERSPEEVAEQFGAMVLIQPNFFGAHQVVVQNPLRDADPDFAEYIVENSNVDPYDVRETRDFSFELEMRAAHALLVPERLEALLGVPLAEVAGLSAAERSDAFRWLPDDNPYREAESAIRAELGELQADDTYYLAYQPACHNALADVGAANAFLFLLERTDVFITNARWDAVVYTEALPNVFELAGLRVSIDSSSPEGSPRPGIMSLSGELLTTSIRFPTYEAGHSVTVTAGAEFGEDLAAWLAR